MLPSRCLLLAMVAQRRPDRREQRAGKHDAAILLGRHDLVLGDLAGNLTDELACDLLGELMVRRGELIDIVRRGEGVLHASCST